MLQNNIIQMHLHDKIIAQIKIQIKNYNHVNWLLRNTRYNPVTVSKACELEKINFNDILDYNKLHANIEKIKLENKLLIEQEKYVLGIKKIIDEYDYTNLFLEFNKTIYHKPNYSSKLGIVHKSMHYKNLSIIDSNYSVTPFDYELYDMMVVCNNDFLLDYKIRTNTIVELLQERFNNISFNSENAYNNNALSGLYICAKPKFDLY